MRAFIIRPFGVKNDIDFDAVEKSLIGPALDHLGVTGRTTGEIVDQGNIRTDMFQMLLTADLVVADVSIHNANVFYELGVRHSLRDRHTFMLSCKVDRLPFDLQTDRYFTYKKEAPDDSLDDLTRALRETIDSGKTNSPVFASLPNMREQDPSQFMAVPLDFSEEVDRAAAEKRLGDLGLLATESRGFYWETEGLRTVGRAQYKLKDFKGAKNTWEVVRRIRPMDLEANLLLGTIYERLGKLTDSMQALDRALAVNEIPKNKKAEAYALQGRNLKTLWRKEWKAVADPLARPAAALRSGFLQESFDSYERAFEEDLNHFYSGLNALAMLRVMIELAKTQPKVWAARFKTPKKAEEDLEERVEHASRLAAAVEVSLNADVNRLEREGEKDVWTEISAADLRCLTSDNPEWVVTAYRDALDGASDQAWDSVRNQLAMYNELGVMKANVDEILTYTGLPEDTDDGNGRKRVLIFTGHMLDTADRDKPRFPPEKENIARQKIKEKVEAEMKIGEGVSFGIAGGANGGDILFHEVCQELGIPTHLYLALPSGLYINKSVRKAGPDWVQRFRDLHARLSKDGVVRVLSEMEDEPRDEKEYLPAWLRSKPDYNIWQRNNLWMLHNALTAGGDDCVTLIALWDCEPTGDGPGGTSDLVQKVEKRGAKAIVINTKKEFGL
jgi:tetratricopeptide (TPR) repeat protein